jgi:hypothetical protein
MLAKQVLKDHKDKQDHRVLPDLLEILEQQVPLVKLDLQVPEEQLVLLDQRGPVEPRVIMEHQEGLDRMDFKEK